MKKWDMGAFADDTQGNFGTVAALSLGVILTAIGGAIDLSGSVRHKQSLQATVDAAILAAATQSDKNNGEIKAFIKDTVKARFGDDVTVNVSVNNDRIGVSAEDSYDTVLLGMFGMPEMGVGIEAEAPRRGQAPIDIALVVDTTDSMAGANMTALRAAATELLNDLEAQSGNVRVALVPYGNYVNIGMGDHSWLSNSKPDEVTDPDPYMYQPQVCTPTGITNSVPRYSDGILTHYDDVPETSCVPDSATPPYEIDPPAKTRSFVYEGCVGSRAAPHNLTAAADASNPIRAAMEVFDNGTDQNWVSCGTQIIPLTDNFTSLRAGVNSLTTSGRTYLPSGLIWGWRTLDPNTPYTQAATNIADGPSRAIIFMTDGGNVSKVSHEYHYDPSGGSEDYGAAGSAVAAQLCDNIKSAGIRIFTVGYDLTDTSGFAVDPNTLLNDCASSNADSYSAGNAFELKQAFKNIGVSMQEVRLSR